MNKAFYTYIVVSLFFACNEPHEKQAKLPVKKITDLEAILKKGYV